MSKFFTPILVDIDAIQKQLPPGSHLDQVVFNAAAGRVDVHWEHDRLRTPYTFPMEMTADKLPKACAELAAQEAARKTAAEAAVKQTEEAAPDPTAGEARVPTARRKAADGKQAKGKRASA